MTIEIHKGELLSLEKNGPRWTIRTLEGTIWLTRSRDEKDYVLKAGADRAVLDGGKVVIEALTEKVRIELSTA